MRLISCLLKLTNAQTSFLYKIVDTYSNLWKKSGTKFLISYSTEVLRLVGNFISGSKVLNNRNVYVAKYKNGLPKILGLKGKYLFEHLLDDLENSRPVAPFYRAFISLLAFFRACSPEHEIKFNTVTAPFNGISESIKPEIILKGIESLGVPKLKLRRPRLFWSTKTGVNAKFAFLSSGLDLLALMRNPRIWLNIIIFAYNCSFYRYIFIYLTYSILLLPLLPFTIPLDLYLGRLAIVKELRGKARVIGITDQWTQWLFKPLHDSIYSFLDTLSEDGTRDQLGPVRIMLKKEFESVVSVDLSAATDRLPVKLQKDILNLIGVDGESWYQILKRPYFYGEYPYYYTVGQPMGAYSSFAMLALTNHIIMHIAHHSAYGSYLVKGEGTYAILGDDVAISDNILAIYYSEIMNTLLGVEINPIKGFNGRLIEFAKNWFHIKNGVNLTPLGAKSLLRSIRTPYYLSSLIADYFDKGYSSILKLELSTLAILLCEIFGKKKLQLYKWLLSILGPQSGLWSKGFDNPEKLNYKNFNTIDIIINNNSVEYQFLQLCKVIGVPRSKVMDWYINKFTKASRITFPSILAAFKVYVEVLKFIFYPLIWNKRKFEYLPCSPEYLALLTGAAAPVILLPIILTNLYLSIPLYLSLYLLSILTWIFGVPYFNESIYEFIKERILIFKQNFDFLWKTLPNGLPVKWYIFSSSSYKIKYLNQYFALFALWVQDIKLVKPIQLMTEKAQRKERIEDSFPVIKTSEKLLSDLVPTYKAFLKRVKIEERNKLKIIKNKKKRKMSVLATSRK
nr:MAG: putative RNA dependent RNA polymerase [Guangdong mito-like virus 9]